MGGLDNHCAELGRVEVREKETHIQHTCFQASGLDEMNDWEGRS